jgi:hypothetical protein
MVILRKILVVSILILMIFSESLKAGPPFATDDPEPVDLRHWEFYIASMHLIQGNTFTGTLPHFEVNYGAIKNLQIHLILPLNYSYINRIHYGYGNTEFGVKYRFVQETDHFPQIATFPIVEIPTVQNSEFSSGKVQVYIPVWLQKSWGKLTSYGGGGYWINPGTGNNNWFFSGWEVQYDFSEKVTLGGELYYQSADASDSKSSLAFNLGGLINFSSKFHFLFSLGHSIINDNFYTAYFGVQWTI